MSECLFGQDGEANPIHLHSDGSYWWWDETWADEYGPYATEEIASDALEQYCDEVLGI